MREIWRTIKKNVQASLSDLDKTCIRTNRELVFGAVACTAVGILAGIMFAPKKSVTIGSHNGNNNAGSPSVKLEGETSEDAEDEEEE